MPSTRSTVQSAKQAIAFFEEAVKRDPDYALAYAGLADAYLTDASVGAARTALEPGGQPDEAGSGAPRPRGGDEGAVPGPGTG
ncbi:hypothetical protein LuPra_00799 [Luteitalea pratensis]|uniref:Tetratricopeptide repeat protein n=1 Tax=Luteitalea pratensis TaxID=1855912 RepID=A0A143PGG7_LUTPR|nr:hypothetical protein LuPra_00799 [Luteitalea pratensis]